VGIQSGNVAPSDTEFGYRPAPQSSEGLGPGDCTHVDWFAGIGGFSLGFERAGFRTVAYSEIDPFACAVLRTHWPDIPNLGNIADLARLHLDGDGSGRRGAAVARGRKGQQPSGGELDGQHAMAGVPDQRLRGRGERGSDADAAGVVRAIEQPGDWRDATVWTGGFPCQDLSVAGRRAGLAGARSGLALEFLGLARRYTPPWIVLENVPGLLSSHRGRDLGTLVGILGDIGYADVAWRVLDARYFGVAQRRRRVFLVASRERLGARTVLFESEIGGWNPPSRSKAGEDVAYTLADSSGTRTGSGRDAQDTFVISTEPVDVASTFAGLGHHGRSSPRGDGTDNFVIRRGEGDPDGRRLRRPDDQGRRPSDAGGQSDERPGDAGLARVAGPSADTGGVRDAAGLPSGLDDPDRLAATLNSNTQGGWRYDADQAANLVPVYRKAARAREEDGWESWREADVSNTLNTFDDQSDSRATHAVVSAVEDDPLLPEGMGTPRYRVLGNAVAVPVVEWIARRMMEVIRAG